jgi:hypothetical protein
MHTVLLIYHMSCIRQLLLLRYNHLSTVGNHVLVGELGVFLVNVVVWLEA